MSVIFIKTSLLLKMLFTGCNSACPILVQDMKRIEAALPANQLKNFAERIQFDKNWWTLLTTG